MTRAVIYAHRRIDPRQLAPHLVGRIESGGTIPEGWLSESLVREVDATFVADELGSLRGQRWIIDGSYLLDENGHMRPLPDKANPVVSPSRGKEILAENLTEKGLRAMRTFLG